MTPNQLKNSILQLAIQGKLVEQRPEEGTAEELYKQIQAEKAELIKQGKLKKDKNESTIIKRGNSYFEIISTTEKCIDDELPFEIPDSWRWARLGNIFNLQAGKNITASDITQEKSNNCPYLCFGGNGIRGYVCSYNRDGHFAIIGRQGALCGCINFAKGKFYATEHAVVVDHFNITDVIWGGLFLRALNLNQYATATAQPGLSVNKISKVLIPLPPLAEQHRIVAKIEELLPMVEKYGEAYNNLETLNKSFPAEIKKSILQYAIQGKLTEGYRAQGEGHREDPFSQPNGCQLPHLRGGASSLPPTRSAPTQVGEVSQSDERGLINLSAEELLKHIQAEKAELIKQGKIKKEKNESTIIKRGNSYFEKIGTTEKSIDDELPFEIPGTWRWARLANISTYGYSKQKQNALNADKNTWCLELEDIEKGGKLLEKKKIADKKAVGDKTIFYKGDILYSKLRPYLLKILVADDNGICTPEIVPFKAFGKINHNYLVNYLKSPFVDALVNSQTYGMKMPRAGAETLLNLLVPLPPLAEQQAIVSKIEQLIKLVDKL